MDKRVGGLAGAMHEIAKQRDNQMRDAGAISADRLEQLRAFLAAELPLEAALFAAARQRDELLSLPKPALPSVVEATLIERVESVRTAAKPLAMLRQVAAWLRPPSFTAAYRAAAVMAGAIVIASFVFHFSSSNGRNAPISDLSGPSFIVNPPAFTSDPSQLSLRLSRVELASLDPSLLKINRTLPDFERGDQILPLDLQIRQIRLNVEALRMP